jgi:hypothetical protein
MLNFKMEPMGAQLGGWTKKGGTAAEYKSAGSNYRTYKPTLSNTPGGGLLATTKLDHICGWAKDDHNQLDMEFDPSGQLVSVRSIMQIQGTPQFDTGLIKAAAALHSDRAAQIAEVGAKIVNGLTTFVTDLNEHGGRANFPAVVRHNFNLIATSVEPLVTPDGTLLKEQSNPAVYVVYGGAKFHIPSEEEFLALGFAWEAIRVEPDGALVSLPNVPRDGTLLKERSTPPVYVMRGGRKSHIPNEQRFEELGFAWSDIRVVPDGVLARFLDGAPA